MQNTFGVKVFQTTENLARERLRDLLVETTVFPETARNRATRYVFQKAEGRVISTRITVRYDGGSTHMLKKVGVSSKPRYDTMLGWSRSFRVSLSDFSASTTVTCRESSLSLAVLGISTCFTAIISPVVAFSAR